MIFHGFNFDYILFIWDKNLSLKNNRKDYDEKWQKIQRLYGLKAI